ncbi:MAG TPA: hypothetical protein DEA47_00025 [Peptococcaceae bacterium]|nr:MAG: Uncharacterized protein XD50_0321 [Clostridia bacterium 41_269]HBT19768.1 hypothetical protein [Peptococcaceae bacterium]
MDKLREAYVGEYASGKSEIAINRALELHRQGRKVRLVDLDLVEPFYTLRPIKKELEDKGLEVIAWNTGEIIGLGETGTLLKPEMKWALKYGGDVILDIGYGVKGVKVINLLEGLEDERPLKVYAVINVARPMTSTVEEIVEYISTLGKVDGLINNSHLGEETDEEIINEGAYIVTKAAEKLNTPVIATTVAREFAHLVGDKDCMGNPVKILELHMKKAFW